MATKAGGDKRGPAPGRRSSDHELWALAQDANATATEALAIAKAHISTCEQQNKDILTKLENHDQWRVEDLKFQRSLLIGLVSACAMILIGIILTATRLS